MHEVDDYIATLTPANQAEFKRMSAIVKEVVPSVTQGVSYGMPAFMYNGWPLISFMVTKKFLSLYPYSGKVIDKLQDKLKDFEQTPGSVHYSVEYPIPDLLLKEILEARKEEIEKKVPRD
jgi:uncharacterized protein YdhG (YjbR/CyaY superfamily)